MLRLAVIVFLAVGCAVPASTYAGPPAGEVWFGSSFDAETFAVSGNTRRVAYGDQVAIVGTFSREVQDQVILATDFGSSPLTFTGSAGSYGIVVNSSQLTPQAGEVGVRFLDVGGNELASGTLTVE